MTGLHWEVREGAKANRVTLETEAGQGAKGKVEFRLRGQVLEGGVRLDEVQLEGLGSCAEEGVEVESEVVVGDGLRPAVRLELRRGWACVRRRGGQVRGLEVNPG